jgi:GntR family transcriptional regulator
VRPVEPSRHLIAVPDERPRPPEDDRWPQPVDHARVRTFERGGAAKYRQLADDMRARILAGEFGTGDPIPTEAELSRSYRTSRITVRHALELLAHEGLVHREQGRGSFVRPRAIAVGPRRLTSFTQELRERGARHTSRVLSVELVDTPPDAPLDVPASDRCLRLERLRIADGRPIAHQVTVLPEDVGEAVRSALTDDSSLYECLRRALGMEIDSADETYRVGSARSPAARLLELRTGTPVFIVERVGFAGTRRVEWTMSVVRGEDYEVHVHLRA